MEPNNKAPLKIVFFSALPPFRGGISSFSKFLVNALKSKVGIHAFTFKKQYPDFLFPGETQFETNQKETFPRVVTSYNPFTYFRASRRLKADQPNVFVANYWMPFFSPMYVFMAKQFSKSVCKVALIHNLTPHEKRFFDKKLNHWFVNNFDLFVVLSEKVRQDVLSYNPNALCKVIGHPKYEQFGVKKDRQTHRANLGIDTSEKVLLYFGLIRDYKGLDLLIDSLNFLDDSYVLLIAGEVYGDKKKYGQQIEQLKDKKVIFHDAFIPDEEVVNYFSAADCCVLPYKSGTQSGIQAIANSFQVPVLVSTNGGLHEGVLDGQNGFVLDSIEPKAIASKILEVFSGGKLQIVKENLHLHQPVKQDEWSDFADELLDFISLNNSKR